MPNIGNATLTINPTFGGSGTLTRKINGELSKVDASSSGSAIGNSVGKGLLKSTAIFAAVSQLASTAISSVTSHVSDAVSRLDTLKNYPRVMQSLGYSAEESSASIQLMSDRLSTLPTRLDDMSSVVQGIVAITGDLGQATNAGLALNDMLLASGSNTQLVTSAMEQFRQMLAKGKPDMQDWKSLTSAMPGQMKQLAEEMLGAGASADDLYAALGGGKNEAIFTMDELLNKMIELDQNGGASMTSFKDQAETASGGIATSMANMQNAITKGLASVMDTIGQTRISGMFNSIKSGINSAFSWFNTLLPNIIPIFESMGKTISATFEGISKTAHDVFGNIDITSLITKALTGAKNALKGFSSIFQNVFTAATAVLKTFQPLISGVFNLLTDNASVFPHIAASVGIATVAFKAFSKASDVRGTIMSLVENLNPLQVAFMAVGTVVTLVAGYYLESARKAEELKEVTNGLSDAAKTTEPKIRELSTSLENEKRSAEDASTAVENVVEQHKNLAESIQNTNQSAQDNIDSLTYAQGIIAQYMNVTGLSAGQQAALKDAIETVNSQCETQYSVIDAANGVIQDENGAIQGTTESIDAYIKKKQESLIAEAAAANLKESMIQYQKDELAYNQALADYKAGNLSYSEYEEAAAALESSAESVAYFTDKVNGAAEGTTKAEDMLRELSSATDLVDAAFDGSSEKMDKFYDACARAGISQEQFAQLSREDALQLITSWDEVGDSIDATGESLEYFADMPAANKDVTVTADIGELTDAQGRVYVWNNGVLEDKETGVTADVGQFTDAYGSILKWNGSRLEPKLTYVTCEQGTLDSAEQKLGRLSNYNGKTISVGVKTTWSQVGNAINAVASRFTINAAGGIRTHADGGVRTHADGAIATSAIPLDIVGEDGAEAIVPLTNRRYSQPFIDLITDGIKKSIEPSKTLYQTINFNQPIQSPDEVARSLRLQQRYGLAATI